MNRKWTVSNKSTADEAHIKNLIAGNIKNVSLCDDNFLQQEYYSNHNNMCIPEP